MALSYSTIEKTYKIFAEIKQCFLPTLRIPICPEDASYWNDDKKENPPVNIVLGCDLKEDNGWESIFFFTDDPSPELISKFKELAAENIRNSIICRPRFNANDKIIWCIGWF